MPISVTCQCGKRLQAKDEHAGKRAKCRHCGRILTIPGKGLPGYDVFISYSAVDKTTGEAICATLETGKIRCWMAPRDITPGKEWGEAIIEGMDQCRIMVLVFSSNSNNSQQVRREVERAVSKGLMLIPFRIEDVRLSKSMEYFLSSSHWLDALTPPLEEHVQRLAETVQVLLSKTAQAAVSTEIAREPSPPDGDRKNEEAPPAPVAAPPAVAAERPPELCTDCGRNVRPELVSGKQYCPSCGRPWTASGEAPSPSPQEPAPAAADQSPQPCPYCGQRVTPDVVGGKRYCSSCGRLWTISGESTPASPQPPASTGTPPEEQPAACRHCGHSGPPSLVAGVCYCSECGARL